MWNLLQDELGGGLGPRLLVALVDTGAKGLILMAAAGLAAAAMRRNAAAARHLVWMLALCGLLLLPIASLMMPKWTLPILPALEAPAPPAVVANLPPTPTPQPAPPTFIPPPTDALATTPPNAPPMPASQPAPATLPNATLSKPAPNPVNLPAWALALWLAVAFLSIAPFIAGIIAVARLRRRANTFADSDLQALATCLAQTLAMKRPARLLRAPTGAMPMATGFLRPAVFLPEDALAWTEEKRRVVLLHELAHVKRRDCLTHAIARTATALHWFNPLAWLALRQLRIEREHACDDLVLAAGERPSAYAENLLEIARTLRADTITAAAAITMAQKSQLEGRLLAVLDAARNRGLVTRKFAVICIAAVSVVVGVLGAVAVTREIATAGDLLAIAKPVKKTSMESFFGGWRNLPFKLSDGDAEAIAQCLALSQRYNAIHNGVNRFSLPEVRESLEALLSKHPDFFYVEHLLGTWHQMNGNTTLAEDYFLRSYRHAPVVLIQRYEHADGSPIPGAAIRQFEIECNRVQGGSLDPSLNLKYFALTTDSEGCVYLPVYDTVYRATAMSFPEGFKVGYPKLGWFESRGKVAMLPVAASKDSSDEPPTANANSNSAIPDYLKGSWGADAKEVHIANKAFSLPLALQIEEDGTISGHLGEVSISDAQITTWTAQDSLEQHQDFDHKIEGHLKGALDGTPYDGPVLIGLIDQDDHWLARPFIMDPSGVSQMMYGLSHYRMKPSQTLHFTGGLVATIVAVGDSHGAKPHTFWHPDGTPIEAEPAGFESILSVLHSSKDEVEREFLLCILPQPGGPAATDMSARWRILAPSRSGSGGQNVQDNVRYIKAAMSISQNLASADLELGIAAGPWTTVVEAGFATSSTIGEYSLAVNNPYERDSEMVITVSHNVPPEKDCRLVAFDKNEIPHPLIGGAGLSAGQFTQSDYSLDGLSREDINRFELQVRDVEWKKFEGITLNPDTTKTPKVSESPEAQNVSKPASHKQPQNADANYSVEFPGGYRAHVVSVRDANGGSSGKFWAGDGSPVALAPTAYDPGDFTLSPETIGRLFFVELLPPPDSPAMTDVTFMCSIESPGSSTGLGNSGSGEALRSELFATFPLNTKDGSVKVGVAAGPWKTVFSGCIGCETGVSDSEFSATFSDVFDHDGAKRITTTHKPLQQERRVVAIDAAGAAYPLRPTISRDGEEMSQSEWIFQTIAPEDVKGLEIQVRDYEWRTISDIALYPTEKTAQTNAEQSSAYASESPYSAFNHEYFSTLLEDPNLLTHIAGDAITRPAADTSWGPAVNGLQAAVRFKPEKPEYLLGEKIDMEFLVRNTGPEPLEFLTSETRLFQLYLSRKISTSISVNSDMGKIRRVKLAPGEVASIDGMSNAVMLNGTRQETEEPIGTDEESHPSIHEVIFNLRLPDAYSNSGEFAPRPGDWTGTLTTGKRNLNLVKKLAPDVATDTRRTINIFTDSRDEIESNKPQPVVPAFQAPFALNPRDRFLRTPAADTVWGEVNNGLQASLQFTPERANYILGEAIPFEFLVRNVGNAPVRFVIREYLQYGEPKVLDGSGNSILAESISNTAWPSLVRIQLDPGQCVGLPGEGLAFLPKDRNAASRINYYVGTYFESEAGMYNVQYSFNLPGGSSTTGEFAPQPGDWTGTLTTGMRRISVVESRDPNNPSPLLQVRWLASESGAAKATAMPWRSGSKPTNEPDQLWLLDEVLFTEKDIVGVQALPDQAREHFLVKMQLNDEATTRWEKLTQENLERKMAIVSRGQVLAAPIVNGTIGDGTLTIAGNFSEAEANSFADAIRADHPGMADSFTIPDNAAPTLGPEIEVTIRHSGEDCMIDFDTGKLFTPPNFDGTEDALAWTAKNGIDAGGGNQPEVRGLIGMDLVLNPEENTIWDNAATNGALKHDAFKFGKPGNPVYLSAKGDLPATWTFKTREGGLGIVQILGFGDEEPRGVKIRYRMLEANKK